MTRNVLFLCTGNSARSILSEALTTHLGAGLWRGYSAGSKPTGQIHLGALNVLRGNGITLPELRSKSWNEFASNSAPKMDLIITVCDNAAGETCPLWPGHPATAHWGLPDPAAAPPDQIAPAFARAYDIIHRRITALLALENDDWKNPNTLAAIGQL